MSICVLPCRTTRPEPSRRSTSMPTRRRCTRRTGRGLVITPGDIAPRRVSNDELYVAVLSNAIHLAADTGRVIACPFIPGRLPDDAMAMVVAASNPKARFYPNSCSGLLALRSTNQSAPSAQPPSARPRRW